MPKKDTSIFSEEEKLLFSMISDSLTQPKANKDITNEAGASVLHDMTALAGHQSVLPIIYQRLIKEPALKQEDRDFLELMTQKTAAEFYQILFNVRSSIDLLTKNGIPVVLLKGASIARFFPMPESRKSSDVDLYLLDPGDLSRTTEILTSNGYRLMEEQHANHHALFGTPDNHALELHTMLIEPSEDKKLDQYVENRYTLTKDDLIQETILGISLPVFPDDLLAFHLLLHMLMDFLSSGFGLKLLCDWVVFWNRKPDSLLVKKFVTDVENCRLSNFLSAVTSVCARFLGLKTDGSGTLFIEGQHFCYRHENKTEIFCDISSGDLENEFMQEVLDAERYGKPDNARMVALKDTGILNYIRSFHHQTKLSFPKASRLIIPLPVLYTIVLARFLRNNRTVRDGQSIHGIIKSTNKRSLLVKKLFS